jgi:predicted GNAT family acetyltransferase
MTQSEHAVIDNPEARRYQVETPAGLGILTYARSGDRINLLHTEVPDAAEGRGYAGALVRFALEEARAAGIFVVPSCPYVANYILRHPEYQTLVAR